MKNHNWVAGFIFRRASLFAFTTCLLPALILGAAEPAVTRIALTPFSAPAGNPKLQNAATALPDLLTASLTQDKGFQLVERDKINTVWGELHLTEAGLTSADTVAKMGKILSCDWLLSGSLIPTPTGTQIWVKLIDTQSSVVLDVKSLPYNATNFSATAKDIAGFLTQARTRTGPHEYIALGKFEDRSVSSTREDWTPRLVALIEKHFLDAGYGVVERESVTPVFSEYQLQSAGMTADAKRVKLKPAFWIVSGSWKWFRDTEDKLSVTINIKKMGGGEQMLSFTKPPGAELENAVVDAIQASLKGTGSVTAKEALAAEIKVRDAHVDELTKGRGETYTPSRFTNDAAPVFITITNAQGRSHPVIVDPDFLAQQQSHAQAMQKTLQQAILLNPNDSKSKFLLGMSLFGMADAVQSKHGEALLEETAKSNDPVYAPKAKNWLADVRAGKISFQRDQLGNMEMFTHGNPLSFPNATPLPAAAHAGVTAKTANLNGADRIAVRASHVLDIPAPPPIAHLDAGELTALDSGRVLGKGALILACGKTLVTFDWTGTFGFNSGTDFVKAELPVKINQPITAIANDDSSLWLGTDGGGLIQISQTVTGSRTFTEKDGLPMASISSLRLTPQFLLIGFGHGRNGAFGYLDLATLKFTGMMSPTTAVKSWDESLKPPPSSPVMQIRKEGDGNTFWVGTDRALYRLKFDSKDWSTLLPAPGRPHYEGRHGVRTLSVMGDHAALVHPDGGVTFCKLSENRWSHLNLSDDFDQNLLRTVALDEFEPNHLWVGGQGKITLIDLNTETVIGECKLARHGPIEIMIIFKHDVFFLGQGDYSGTYDLYHMKKPEF